MAVVNLKPSPLVKSGELTREVVEAYSASLNEPTWMTARRLEALRVFRDTPPPQRTDELWRRVELSAFKLDQVLATLAASVQAGSVQPPGASEAVATTVTSSASGWLLHVDGGRVQYHLDPALAAQGVIFTDLATAAREHAHLLEKYLMTEAVKLTDSYFAALHAIFVRSGVVLYVPKGVRIELPLRALTHMSAGAHTGFNHTLVVLEEGAQATLIEEFGSVTSPSSARANGGESAQQSNTSRGDARGGPVQAEASAGVPARPGRQASRQVMYSGAVELILGKNSQLDYVSIQDWGRDVWAFTSERAHLHEGATLHWVVGGMGAKFTKTLLEADMLGANSTALLSGVFFADSKQQMHYDTQQNHVAPGCKSDLLYKNALRDEARTVWRGNIRVFPGAQKTDAYQANRNLQLSSRSRADSIPGLEIEADDVRCTHGATVGQIEQEPMFYMATRGVPEVEARRLIVEGFFAPVIERIPLEETRDRLLEEISKKIG